MVSALFSGSSGPGLSLSGDIVCVLGQDTSLAVLPSMGTGNPAMN